MIRRALSALSVLVLLAGCGGSAGGEEGTAQLWVTRDRGAELLVEAEVDAGQTLLRALAAEAEVETRYGGRYVQSVNGIEGSLGDQRDWFWFVNGYEGDRSAASYKLRDGDVAWLDYRGWEREGEARVVVGSFPEPFVHGFAGKKRQAVVRYAAEVKYVFARQRAAEIGADPKSVQPLGTPVPPGANVLVLRSGARAFTAHLLGQTAGDSVRFVMTGVPRQFKRRYSVP